MMMLWKYCSLNPRANVLLFLNFVPETDTLTTVSLTEVDGKVNQKLKGYKRDKSIWIKPQ